MRLKNLTHRMRMTSSFAHRSMMKMFAVMAVLIAGGVSIAVTQETFSFSRKGSFPKGVSAATAPIIQAKQGFNINLWLGSNGTIGQGAFTDFHPPGDIGCEYPVNSRIEHLFGAGIWIGAAIDTGRPGQTQRIYSVTTGYDWGGQGPRREMYGHQTARDTFFRTSIYDLHTPNRRGEDDDADGGVDEDELDGYDNDHDWVMVTDDVGADGTADSLEVGCLGPFNVLTNPDPAFDNYETGKLDLCRIDGLGNHPRKNNKDFYTEHNGIADHGEPNVDEDYGAVSESDVYVGYKDIFSNPQVAGHVPLGISVFQKSYAWRNFVKEPFIVMEYSIVNVGNRILDSVFIGFFVDPLVGPFDVANIPDHKYVAYLSELRTGYANNAIDRPSTPIGVTVLGTPRPLESLRYTFYWNTFVNNPGTDLDHYERMASGEIKPDQPNTAGDDTQFLFAFGPFKTMAPAETLKVTFAIVSGDGVEVGANPLVTNARKALAMFSNGYRLPAVPPSPPLRVAKGDRRVTLNWDWRLGDRFSDPLQTWDDSDKFVESLPPSHWRRANPPAGHSRGGRIFEGFRLWRSESPDFVPASFTLLRQYDVDDDLGFEFGTGIQYEFIDSNLTVGKLYRYAVTSFSIPRVTIVTIPDPNGGPVRQDTITTPNVESDVGTNAVEVQMPFSPSARVGEVKVVPNPYRTDVDYTFEQGGWEGYSKFWSENERVIWFTHLPEVALIKIFSLTGDHVATLRHDDAARTSRGKAEGQEEWNLLSDSGRAIASGIYLFTVESILGTQLGKFVIIR